MNYQSVQYQGPTAGQPGRIYNWSLNIQHEIKNFLIDVAYQGNRGTRLNSTIDLNQLPTSLLSRFDPIGAYRFAGRRRGWLHGALRQLPGQPERRPVAASVSAVPLGIQPLCRLRQELVIRRR